MAKDDKKKGKASAKVVDFSGVKDRGAFNPRRVQEGDYRAKIVAVEDSETKQDKVFQYLFHIKLDKYSQYTYPYYCQLSDKTLWKLRNLLVAAGLSVPKKRMKLDPSKAVNKYIGVTMEDDEYDGKMKSVIGAVFPVSELAGMDTADDTTDDGDVEPDDVDDDTENDDDKPKKGKKDKKAKGGKKKGKKSAAKDETEEVDLDDL